MIKLIVGVGNPGSDYAQTRHNIAWMVLDNISLNWNNKFKGHYAQRDLSGDKVYYLKPQTYMNLSGESVVPLMQFFKIDLSHVLVIHDEIDLPFGQVMLKKGGGLAGHNGLKSIAGLAGSPDFWRLRLGVGRPVHGSVADYVLSEFSLEEKKVMDSYLKNASGILEDLVVIGPEKAMQKYNKKSLI